MGRRVPLELPSHSVLAQLARDDPCAYEVLRRELIEDFLSSAPERVQQRLRGLQFRIDCVRRLSRSALGSTIKISALMYDSILHLNREISGLHNLDADRETRDHPTASARIIDFQTFRKPRDPVGN